MTAPDQLRALADRCEAATGADRELDALIAVAAAGYFELPPKWEGGVVGYGYTDADGAEVCPGHGGDQLVRRYTASLDAAMTLVPESENHWPQLIYSGLNPNNPSVQKHRYEIWTKTCRKPSRSNSATPALALCAASLRARAASMEEG